MKRDVGGGIGMGNTCKPMAVSFQCMTKFTTNKKKKKKVKKIKNKKQKHYFANKVMSQSYDIPNSHVQM